MDQINSDFRRHFIENWRLTRYVAYKILNSKEAAEDVASDVFVNLYRQMLIRQIPEEKIKPWLVVSAKRRAYNYIRDNKRLTLFDIDFSEEDYLNKLDDKIFVSEMLNRLHKRNKKWFDITAKYYLLGMSTAELAQEYQCSEQAIRNILQRARDYLRAEYKSTDVSLLFFLLLAIRIHYILIFLDISRLFD